MRTIVVRTSNLTGEFVATKIGIGIGSIESQDCCRYEVHNRIHNLVALSGAEQNELRGGSKSRARQSFMSQSDLGLSLICHLFRIERIEGI